MILNIICCLFVTLGWAQEATKFSKLFKNEKPIIAALMIEKDLSTPEKIEKAIKWSKEQIKIAEKHDMDAILFEFRGGKILKPKITEKQFQAMKKVAINIMQSSQKVIIGFEILWHYPQETLRLAHETGAKFVRVDFFSDEVIADKIRVPIDPKALIEYRKKIRADDVVLLTDIQVKYSKMVDPSIPLDVSAKKALKFGSDGVIVTSTKSGRAPEPDRPRRAKMGAGSYPVVIGSGFSYKNAKSLLNYADAVIVGTSISKKTGGPLVSDKVAQLMKEVHSFRKGETYPKQWWQAIEKKKSWEITPDQVKFPKVILSKRNDLGILSNFADTPFRMDGKVFGSMEGFWQATKYPESSKDPRYKMVKWPHTRQEVEAMTGFDAKRAGDFASEVMKKNHIDWVTYNGQRMKYREKGEGLFYKTIEKAMWQKLNQNKSVEKTLLATGALQLLPDHHQKKDSPRAWRYHQIYMKFRDKIKKGKSL